MLRGICEEHICGVDTQVANSFDDATINMTLSCLPNAIITCRSARLDMVNCERCLN